MIEIKNLNFYRDSRPILLDINLKINDNEFAAIIGPNGAGKSTLIKLILGLLKPTTGKILIDGIPNTEWLKKNIIGYLPQREFFDTSFPATVEDIVLMGIAGKVGLFKKFKKEHKNKVKQILKLLKIDNLQNSLIGELSGGQFQRVLLARALISDSKYLILDEPEAGVDRKAIGEFYKLLKDIHNTGKTILIVSHDINIITNYCNFLICLNRTLHCHTKSELINSEVIKKTYGDVIQLIREKYKN